MNKYLLSLLTLAFFISCSTDFDLTTGGKELPVVYAVFNEDDAFHYVRVEQLFVSEEEAPRILAQEESEVFFDNVSVEVRKVGGASFILDRIDVAAEGLEREAGIFLTSPNILYRISDQQLQLQSSDSVIVNVYNEVDSLIASASANVVGASELSRPAPDVKLNFTPMREFRYAWDGDEDAKFYDLGFNFYIREIRNNQAVTNSYYWQPVSGWEQERFPLDGSGFYNFLNDVLEVDPSVIRIVDSADVVISSGGAALKRFIDINNLNTGITSSQVTPTYTNVDGGLGLVSSSNVSVFTGKLLSPATLDSLRNSPRVENLNFQ